MRMCLGSLQEASLRGLRYTYESLRALLVGSAERGLLYACGDDEVLHELQLRLGISSCRKVHALTTDVNDKLRVGVWVSSGGHPVVPSPPELSHTPHPQSFVVS
jgi:hypothetical protein